MTDQVVADTVLGPITLVAEGPALVGVYFAHHRPAPSGVELGVAAGDPANPALERAVAQLQQYLAGRRRRFDLPLDARGDDFQQRVWAALAEVPFGATTTYGGIAVALGDRALAQAVGRALATNPLSIVVPCHRVVGHDGRLTGYAGGVRCKQALLDLERGEDAQRLF